MNNTAPATKQTAYDIFETVTCTRCGGNPNSFSRYGHVAAGRCLKCMGNLRTFTKRGQADYDRYRAAVDAATLRPLADVKPGDRVRLRDMKRYCEVAEVSAPYQSGAYIQKDAEGNRVEKPIMFVTVTFVNPVQVFDPFMPYTSKTVDVQVMDDTKVRIAPADSSMMPKAVDFVTTKK